LSDHFKAIFANYRPDWADFIGFLGFSSLFFGLYQAYKPAAFVVAGVILMAISYVKARR